MENGDMASYTYSPSGDKFMCIYSTANTSTVTMPLGTTLSNGRPAGITVAQNLFMLYMDNVVYEGNPWSTTLHNLSKVITDDGILVRTNSVTESTPVFERNYYVRDHLGNVRVVFDSQGRVRQLNNYTPFGMEYSESAGNQASVGYQDYKFGGKELDRRFELNWYNFGKRFYAPDLSRFLTIDPKAEQYPWQSPYCYAANNPIVYIDKNGENPAIPIVAGGLTALDLIMIGTGITTTGLLVYKTQEGNISIKEEIKDLFYKDNPGYKEQKKRDRESHSDLAKIKLNHNNSVNDNIGGPTPDGSNTPKGGGSKIAKAIITFGLTAEIIKSSIESIKKPVNDINKKGKDQSKIYNVDGDSDDKININTEIIDKRIFNPDYYFPFPPYNPSPHDENN